LKKESQEKLHARRLRLIFALANSLRPSSDPNRSVKDARQAFAEIAERIRRRKEKP
jgi:hypothetical protein